MFKPCYAHRWGLAWWNKFLEMRVGVVLRAQEDEMSTEEQKQQPERKQEGADENGVLLGQPEHHHDLGQPEPHPTFEAYWWELRADENVEWSKSERDRQMSNVWNLGGWYWWACLQGSSGDADTENRRVDTVEEGEGGWIERTAWKQIHYHM